MAERKTQPTGASVRAFLASLDDAQRLDCAVLAKMMRIASGERPVMWGTSIVGYGRYTYHYADGRPAEMLLTGFWPRARDLTIYVMPGFKAYPELMAKLGRHKHSVSCLYLRKLEDVDLGVLRTLVERSVRDMRAKYPA